MKIYLKKISSYIFLSFFIALTFGPFSSKEEIRRRVTNLQLSVIQNDYGNLPKYELPKNELNNYPKIKKFIDRLKINYGSKSINKNQEINPSSKKGFSSKNMSKLIKKLDTMKNLSPNKNKIKKSITLNYNEWITLKEDLIIDSDNFILFTNGFYLKSRLIEKMETIAFNISWFENYRHLISLLFLILGLISLKGLYKKLPGIKLNPEWAVKLGDIIFILLLSLSAFCVLEFFMKIYYSMLPFFDDSEILIWGSMAYIPAVIIFSYFASFNFKQSLEINSAGISVYDLSSSRSLSWDEITKFKLKSSYVAVERVGFPIQKKLQTFLVIKTENDSIYLIEPGLKKIKQKVIDTLQYNAPKVLQESIKAVKNKW